MVKVGAGEGRRQGAVTKAERIRRVAGPATIRTTGVTVAAVLEMTASGLTASEIVTREPRLELADIQAAVAFLGTVLEGPEAATGGARLELGVTRRQLVRYLSVIRIPRPQDSRGVPRERTG